ncbi:MAG TPA: hypothetical protein VGM23_09800, partial [Armatimonadota bacterium]
VDMLGAVAVKKADGSSDPAAADIVGGRLYEIWYDGAQFRLMPTTAGAVEAVGDPGANGMVYRSGPGAALVATADQMSGAFHCQDTSSTANAYNCDLSPAITGYTTGTIYWFKAGAAGTGAATVNFNGLGAKAIKKRSNVDLAAGDIGAGQWVMLTYDGTNMQMLSQTSSGEAIPPTAHAATHQHGGTDEVAEATSGANRIPKAGADGKLAAGWLPAPGASTLGGVQATDCSGTGLVQKINSDGTVTCAAPGFTPLDLSWVTIMDEFACGASGTCLPWYSGGTGSTNNAILSAWPHLGIYKVGGTAAAAGNNGYITLMSSASGQPPLGVQSTLTANGPWEAHWGFQLNQTNDTRVYLTLHSHGTFGLETYSPIGLRYDTQLGDTNFMFVANPGWSGGAISSGVAADTNWHHFKIHWVSAGRIGFSLDGGEVKTACASGCDLTVSSWSSGLGVVPSVYCGSDTTAHLTTVNIDYFAYTGQVGAR